jgi:transposase
MLTTLTLTILQKYAETGSIQDRKKTGIKAKLHTDQHAQFVNNKMEETPDLSAKKLTDAIEAEFHIQVSISTVRRYRRSLGWVASRTRYCQMIRHANKEKRVRWCQEQIEANEQFDVSEKLFIYTFCFTLYIYIQSNVYHRGKFESSMNVL